MCEICASIKKITDVLSQNLEIPTFQRPYCWDDRNVRQLLQDVYDSWKSEKQSYRIGSTILFGDPIKPNSPLQIVDGQQRITTILLVLKQLAGNNNFSRKSLCSSLNYEHEESRQQISENYNYIGKWINERISNEKNQEFQKYLLDYCEFVEIKVTDLSEAFQMFDSQNGRGKPLEAYNLLKAYHIRAMEVETQDTKIECDKRWESATRYETNPNDEQDILKQVINEQLYRTREWSRNLDAYGFDNTKIVEFKGVSIDKRNSVNFVYQNTELLNYIAIRYLNSIGINVKGIKSRFYPSDPENINPFVLINQNIINGKLFFDYIETYVEVYKRLFINQNDNSSKELTEFRKFFKQYCKYAGSNRLGDTYLREVYKSLIFVLFDKFGEEGLYQYYKTLYVLIYRLRLEKKQVKYDFVAKYPKSFFASIDKAKDLNLNFLNKKALEPIVCIKKIPAIIPIFVEHEMISEM
jgi:hypothetical protein